MNLSPSLPKVILCEGMDDVKVLESLLALRNIDGYQVRKPELSLGDTGGWTKFGRALLGYPVDPGQSLHPCGGAEKPATTDVIFSDGQQIRLVCGQ